jgi:hypothetical protein
VKAVVFAAPVLVLVLLQLLHRVEVWAERAETPSGRVDPLADAGVDATVASTSLEMEKVAGHEGH